jgi:transcriptional regulator with XRE-family HTH domain
VARAASDDLTLSSRRLAERVGGRLRSRRTSLGLTLAQTARVADVSVSHLSSIETGATLPSLPILARIVAALDLALNDVLRDVGGASDAIRVERLDESARGVHVLSNDDLQLQVVSLVASPGEQGDCPIVLDGAGIFVFVRDGSLEASVDGTVNILAAGDSLHADEPSAVSWRAVGVSRSLSVWARGPLPAG